MWAALALTLAVLAGPATAGHAAVGDLVLVSRPDGTTGAADGASSEPAISSDGRFVAFSSFADNLSPDDRDGTRDVFVRDLVADTTTLVSRADGPAGPAGDGDSSEPSLSADGRFVAFTSRAANLHAGADRGIRYVFVRDLRENTTTLVSRGPGPGGAVPAVASFHPSISGDGRFVAFGSLAGDLAGLLAPGGTIYVRDMQTGAVTVASRADGPAGAPVAGIAAGAPSISHDGRHVAFAANGIFLRDIEAGRTTLVSAPPDTAGPADGHSLEPSVSDDGRFVAFVSYASNLSDQDLDGPSAPDVFVRDVQAGTITLVSTGELSGHAGSADISGDGRHVSFGVRPPFAATSPLGIYASDLTAAPVLVSDVPSAALPGTSAISADGRYVAFASSTEGLVEGGPSQEAIFRRDVLGPPPGSVADPVCAPAPAPAEPADGSSAEARFTLSRAQLLINQRIAQAAIRRLNAVQARLDAGLAAPDLCGHAIGAEDLAPAITTTVAAASLAPAAPAAPAPVRPAPAGDGDPAAVRLTAAQLLINQRIGQAAVRRANGLAARLEAGLTGGDLLDGQVSQGKLADRLQVTSAPATPAPAPSQTVIAPRAAPPDPGSVRLTVAQLRINQRVYQAAVRRANALVARLEAGVTGTEIRDGSLTGADLDAGIVPAAS